MQSFSIVYNPYVKNAQVIIGQGDGAVITIELTISPTAAAALARDHATLTILGAVALGIYVYNHLPDGTPTDPSILEAWNSAVTLAIEGKVDALLLLKK